MHTEPGPIPILTISAPAKIKASVISPVTTFPAINGLSNLSLTLFTRSKNNSVYPLATSKHMNLGSFSFSDFKYLKKSSAFSASSTPKVTAQYSTSICFDLIARDHSSIE